MIEYVLRIHSRDVYGDFFNNVIMLLHTDYIISDPRFNITPYGEIYYGKYLVASFIDGYVMMNINGNTYVCNSGSQLTITLGYTAFTVFTCINCRCCDDCYFCINCTSCTNCVKCQNCHLCTSCEYRVNESGLREQVQFTKHEPAVEDV